MRLVVLSMSRFTNLKMSELGEPSEHRIRDGTRTFEDSFPQPLGVFAEAIGAVVALTIIKAMKRLRSLEKDNFTSSQ